MKLYLAHSFESRKMVREIELDIEKEIGIELLNPFYDLGRIDIIDIDKGLMSKDSESLDYITIVNQDLISIYESDAILAVLCDPSIGTSMEIWFALSIGRPIYIVTEKHDMHPWIRYAIKTSNGKAFKSFEGFKEFIKGEICQY